MAGIEVVHGVIEMTPGPWDVHAHPRVFDPIVEATLDPTRSYEGKAGLSEYSRVALESGIVGMSAMSNEFTRRYSPSNRSFEMVQWPISNYDRRMAMETAIATQSLINTAYHLGLDPSELYTADSDSQINLAVLDHNFELAGENAAALKVFGAVSTGGNMIKVRDIPEVARRWTRLYPNKPVIMHLEDENVGNVLEELFEMEGGEDIPVHIAHVSSRQELEAAIIAKQRGMNVTCEVTPHHMFASQTDGVQIGGYGCMKPTLKSQSDIDFLWDNLEWIDVIASDCAPHQHHEKLGDNPTYGVTNHTSKLPLFIGAVDEGRMSWDDLYSKMVVNPRRIFNLPEYDGSSVRIDISRSFESAQEIEAQINPVYGENIFPHLERLSRKYHLLGQVVFAQSGASIFMRDPAHLERHPIRDFNRAHKHLITTR